MEPSRTNFCHPYQPYDIQLQFMESLYRSIEDRKIAIFESPTGTGKSLSLICGALTWLRDNARRQTEGAFDEQGHDDDDWLAAAERASLKRAFLEEREELEKKLVAVRRQEARAQETQAQARMNKKARIEVAGKRSQDGDYDDFMLDDYNSDDDKVKRADDIGTLSTATLALLEKLKPAARQDEDQCEEDRTKIIFCSRTHSQLTQFVNELKRVTPPPSISQATSSGTHTEEKEVVKHLALGSRKNLCINEKVLRLSSTIAINERCLDLQKPTTAKEHKCKYLPQKEDKARIETFRDRAIATIRDIEDTGKLGREMELCPYYASRPAIASCEILTLPYPLLLQKTAREALGVSLKDNVVVIDEAHNLMDAIAETLSMSLPLSHLDLATKQVVMYVQRFKNKLKGSNRMYLTQLIRLLNSFTACLRAAFKATKQGESVVTAADLMSGKGVDQVKPHRLLQYLIQSKLAHKVEGYTDAQEDDTTFVARPKGILMQFQSFLAILMNPDSEGRFFLSRQDNDITVRYTLLDPTEHFREVVDQARAVILAGGTMSPMSDYADHLFSYLDGTRLSTFSFGHVIPKTNMLALPVSNGPSGVGFEFTFERRNSQTTILELGAMLVNICRAVPDGLVVFFPSYDYLSQVTSVWKAAVSGQSIMSLLSSLKKVFEEVRGTSVEDLLRDYTQAIDTGSGGLMLSVVGGKLSEGINFSDKLGRAVVAVGLPFPNMNSAEWKAKIAHIEQTRYTRCRQQEGLSEDQSKTLAKAAGRDFYENACMRAVNQSIGRAIRHKNDYAAIMLVDKRFATQRISNKLPQWIRSSMREDIQARTWASIEADLCKFFSEKRV